jgi:hypothetical protein
METALDPVPVDALTTLLSLSDKPLSDIDPDLVKRFVTQILGEKKTDVPVARFGSAI